MALAPNKYDENKASHEMDLQSRTIAALGIETMRNLSQLTVLIIGCRGVGIETAKNLTLAGPKGITVWDNGITRIADLGANFFLTENDVGKRTRAEAVSKSLSELNPLVNVQISKDEKLSDEFIQSFGAIVVTETLPRKELYRINGLCRKRSITDEKTKEKKVVPSAFILAVTHGVSAHFFSDFGDGHVITDPDGEPIRSYVIEDFNNQEGVVTVAGKKHGFDDDDQIKFEEIEGEKPANGLGNLSELNNVDNISIKRIYKTYYVKRTTDDGKQVEDKREKQIFNQFKIDLSKTKLDLKNLSKWKQGGLVNEVKKQKIINFKCLETSFESPTPEGDMMQQFMGPPHPDQGAWEQGVGKLLHLCYDSVLTFQEKEGRFPNLHDKKDSENFLKYVQELNEINKKKNEEKGSPFVENLDKKRIRAYSWYFTIELTGYCAFLGGVAAQEVIKKFGKYTPVNQWLHSDHVQLIGNQVPSDAVPQNSRYDHQISLFGKAFQHKISNQKIFLVGCGALGCEYLKGLALMGVGTGERGQIWCTDMDRIEISNLSRQFLFRSVHVRKPKSITAAGAVKEMNKSLNIKPLEMKVWSETENYFDDDFWENLDICWNALDNVQARKYTDSKCLFYNKPLLESGTQGTKCNSEVIIPYKTKSYNDGEEQETEGIPMCTLQNFPHIIEHCIEWARSEFGGLFENIPKMYNTFIENSAKFFEQVNTAQGEEKVKMLRDIKKFSDLQKKGNITYQDCIQLAFDNFVDRHITLIKDLTYSFPEDEKIKDDAGNVIGNFWSGHKRFPQAPKFSIDDDAHLDYLFSAGNLYVYTFGLKPIDDRKLFKAEVEKAKLQEPKWSAKAQKIKINEDEEKKNENNMSEEQENEIKELLEYLKKIDSSKLKKLQETEFEKDDDTNFHIDFITICANSRAWNYKIKEASRQKIKIIAGKIIAALATTTAMITGLVELEFYKLKLGHGFIQEDGFYNANINLAVSQFQYFQPDAAIRHIKTKKYDEVSKEDEEIVPYPDLWTSWDKLVVDEGNLTVAQFVDLFPQLFWGLRIKLLFKQGNIENGQLLYNDQAKERKPNPMDVTLANDQKKSEAIRKAAQSRIDSVEQWNVNVKAIRGRKIIDLYIELYGELPSKKRNYVVLSGDFIDQNDHVAVIPPIKYIFDKKK